MAKVDGEVGNHFNSPSSTGMEPAEELRSSVEALIEPCLFRHFLVENPTANLSIGASHLVLPRTALSIPHRKRSKEQRSCSLDANTSHRWYSAPGTRTNVVWMMHQSAADHSNSLPRPLKFIIVKQKRGPWLPEDPFLEGQSR